MPIFPKTSSFFKQLARTGPPVLSHLATGRPVGISSVAINLFQDVVHPPRILGAGSIPETPFVLVFNHYESSRAAAWWGPLLMGRVIAEHRAHEPREVRFVMAREWAYSGWAHYIKEPLTHALFARLAQVYGLILVPPVLDGDPNRGEGVGGVRQALALTRGANPQLIGIAPEGHTGPEGMLKEPPQGAGLFLLLLTHDTIPCFPVGWWDEPDRTITIKFGSPFQLTIPRIKDRQERDRMAATRVMVEIGKLLPERLWGAYRQPIGECFRKCHE